MNAFAKMPTTTNYNYSTTPRASPSPSPNPSLSPSRADAKLLHQDEALFVKLKKKRTLMAYCSLPQCVTVAAHAYPVLLKSLYGFPIDFSYKICQKLGNCLAIFCKLMISNWICCLCLAFKLVRL